MSNATLYEQDFHAWANEQAALLRAGRWSEADIEHVAEEIESMGKSERRELVSRLAVLLHHLLKWQFQPSRRCKSWQSSVRIQRNALGDHLHDNPSLQAHVPEALHRAYREARLAAIGEIGLSEAAFAQTCPWTFEQIMDENFWPGEA